MSQPGLFDNMPTDNRLPRDLLDYQPGIFTPEESQDYLELFIHNTPWAQRKAHLYGKEVITPRLTAFYGEPGLNLSRPEQNQLLPWSPELLAIKDRIDPIAGVTFNSVLLNYYRDGNDSVSWHSDNDGIPGKNRLVASLSFGQKRRFDVRKTDDHTQKFSVELASGSYLLMQGDFQDQWQHRIAKSTQPMGPRINLTFRILH